MHKDIVLRGRKPNIANKMYQCNKNYCQSAYTKAGLSYYCYAVNTSVAVQQCDLHSTSSICKVGFLRLSCGVSPLCHLATTAVR